MVFKNMFFFLIFVFQIFCAIWILFYCTELKIFTDMWNSENNIYYSDIIAQYCTPFQVKNNIKLVMLSCLQQTCTTAFVILWLRPLDFLYGGNVSFYHYLSETSSLSMWCPHYYDVCKEICFSLITQYNLNKKLVKISSFLTVPSLPIASLSFCSTLHYAIYYKMPTYTIII